jgi:dihydrofolate reductase
MCISAICSAAAFQGKLAIVYDNDLLANISADMKFFAKMTKESLAVGCGNMNYVIMGRKTWQSIGCQPLPHRINIVITRNPKKYIHETYFKDVTFMTFEQFLEFYAKKKQKVNVGELPYPKK